MIEPVPVPDVGFRLIHGWFASAVQLIGPPLVFVTEIAWAAGLAPPRLAVKPRLPGLTDSEGGSVTVRVTGMVWGEPVAPGAVMVTAPL